VSSDLRTRALLSVQRALIGEVIPEMQAIAVELQANSIHIVL